MYMNLRIRSQATLEIEEPTDVQSATRPALLDELSQRTLSDIAIELETLRDQNTRLKQDLTRLEEDLQKLRPELLLVSRENEHRRGAVKFLMREGGFLQSVMYKPPTHITSLPPEVLLRIFKATMPLLHEYDPSIMRAWSPWEKEIRFRKGLVLVCKSWSWPATAVLYEDIVLRRMGQIPALARTLSLNEGRDLCHLIQHIRMDSCVIWQPCADVVKHDLLQILQRCVALRSLSFHTHPNFLDLDDTDNEGSWLGFNPTWFVQDHTDPFGQAIQTRLSSGLRELDISMELSHGHIIELHKLLTSAPALLSLKLGHVNVNGVIQGFDTLPEVRLPKLTELQIYQDNFAFSTLVCGRWAMPALKTLTAFNCLSIPIDILRKHGRALTYLHICPKRRTGIYDYNWEPCLLSHLDELGTLCPALEHLVFPAAPTTSASAVWASIRSSTLRYLDLWCHVNDAAEPWTMVEFQEPTMTWREILPSLVKVRILRRIVRPDVPLVCHPSLVSGEDDMRVHRFGTIYVLQTPSGTVPNSGLQKDVPWFVHLTTEEEDDSSDYVASDDDEEDDEDGEGDEEGDNEDEDGASDESPYEPLEDDDASGSERTEDSDVSDDEPDAHISEWEWPGWDEEELEAYDRDTILEMFSATHAREEPDDEEDEEDDSELDSE